MTVLSILRYTGAFQEALCRPTKKRISVRDISKQLRNYWAKHADPLEIELPNFPFLKETYQPYHFNDALAGITPQSLRASPGFRYANKGFATKAAVLNDKKAVNDIRCFIHNIKQGKPRTASPVKPCIVSATKNLETGEIKTRMAWPFPIEVYAAEAMFARPIIDTLPDDYIPTPERCHYPFCTSGYSVDFESFDQTVPLWLLKLCFDNLMSRFNLEYYADLGEGAAKVSSKYSLSYLIYYIRRYLCYTPFRIGNKLFKKYHGMPSGSMLTNILDTMISYTVMTYAHKIASCPAIIKTYGDDTHIAHCCCFNPRGVSTPAAVGLVERVQRLFGMNIKLQETLPMRCHAYCKKKCFLGTTYHDGLWFSNILNCCQRKYIPAVAYQLATPDFQATKIQREQLLQIAKKGELPPKLQNFIDAHRLCPPPGIHSL